MNDPIISSRALAEGIALVEAANVYRESSQLLELLAFLQRLKRQIERPVVNIEQGTADNVFLIDGDPWFCDPRASATAQAFFSALKHGVADTGGRSRDTMNNARGRLLKTLPERVEKGIRKCRIAGCQIIFDRLNSQVLFN